MLEIIRSSCRLRTLTIFKYKSLHQHHGLLAAGAFTLPKLMHCTNRPNVPYEKENSHWLKVVGGNPLFKADYVRNILDRTCLTFPQSWLATRASSLDSSKCKMFLALVSPVDLRLKPRTKCTFPGFELASFLHVLKNKEFLSKLFEHCILSICRM